MRFVILTTVATCFFCSGMAWPDRVFLKDGSQIIGTVTGVDSGKLKVQTEFADEIRIDLKAIRSIETETENGYKLDSGEIFSGILQYEDGRQELLRGDERMVLSPTTIVAIGDPLELSSPTVRWFGRAEFGFTFEDGNTDELDVHGDFRTTREAELSRLILFLRGKYGETNGDKTDNMGLGGSRYEYDLNERLFTFGQAQLEYDEFEGLDSRLIISGGLGYFFIKNDRQTLRGLASIGYQHEDFEDGTNTDNILLPLSYEYRLKVRDWFHFQSGLTFYANVTDTNNWRFEAENSLEVPISPTESWKLRFGVRNDYDNDPLPGIKEMDTTVFSSLVYNWE